ncbi:hypothetical protein ILP92_06430 [Maribius pontilimi]|uniref:Uncharacterized protein n=1 Tax=Palleronia pontilimi TaxID=1964209 RepID=A0A934M9C1_9RHOB|nr:hypothetical protein [Palleronia pontilimi]MBJ3762377.1 hypothetical protein [Palleronia pontilimi]
MRKVFSATALIVFWATTASAMFGTIGTTPRLWFPDDTQTTPVTRDACTPPVCTTGG